VRLKLYDKRLFILCDAVEERKVGSIIIADKHSERSRLATVLAVGDKVKHPGKWWQFWLRPHFKPGDRILISWYTGVHLHVFGDKVFGQEIDEDRHRFVMEGEILTKVLPD
jgi:co-chaperonin GroES (HSP10)